MPHLRLIWFFAAVLMVSCVENGPMASKGSASDPSGLCGAVTNAINRGDWDSLRRLAKPGMGGSQYITMWKNARRTGHGIRVGKQIGAEHDVEFNRKKCTRYTFALENEDGTANPHQLQILIWEHSGKSELLDFWNFGW